MQSSEYWQERFAQLEQSQNQRGVRCRMDIEKQYRQAQKQLEGQIASWYQRFADNNKITLAEAHRLLSTKELEEFKWDVNQYIQYGQENAVSGTWVKQLENASARFHINRLEALKIHTQQSMEVMFGNQLDTIDNAMSGIYKSGYYKTAYEIQKGVGVGWDFSTLDDKQIAKVINKPWAVDGKNFSERVWGNRQKLVNELSNTLTQNIVLGKDPQKAIDEISRKMNTSKTVTGRLVMTEEAFFSSAAQKDCFTELDVEQFEIVATLDSHTSDICREMDGKHFPMSKWEVGVTAPPFHVWCRSTTVPFFDDEFETVGERAARDADGKTYYVPSDMAYPDWKKSFVDGNGDEVAKADLKPVEPGDTIKVKEEKTFDESIQDFLDGSTDRETLGKKILKEYHVENVPVNIIGMSEYGCCRVQVDTGTLNVVDYNLNANDERGLKYQVKTAFHEAYHASGNGYATNYDSMDTHRWLDMEETFAESTSHYMSQLHGITDITPSYPDKLVKMLPRLKKLPEFSECSTISDFGRVAQELRQKGGGSAWKQLSQTAMRKKFDFGTYTQQYFPEIKKDVTGYVDKILENMPKSSGYKNDMISDLEKAMKNVETYGYTLSDNETLMLNNAVAVAMNRIGVK